MRFTRSFSYVTMLGKEMVFSKVPYTHSLAGVKIEHNFSSTYLYIMLRKIFSILCKISTPENLALLPTAFIFAPITMYGVFTHKPWTVRAGVLTLVWIIGSQILYFLTGLVVILFEKLKGD